MLVIPKRHIGSLDDIVDADAALLGAMMLAAKQVAAAGGARAPGIAWSPTAVRTRGQSVFHVHFHVLGGRPMSWPPG